MIDKKNARKMFKSEREKHERKMKRIHYRLETREQYKSFERQNMALSKEEKKIRY
jgi:hypothetical protein